MEIFFWNIKRLFSEIIKICFFQKIIIFTPDLTRKNEQYISIMVVAQQNNLLC